MNPYQPARLLYPDGEALLEVVPTEPPPGLLADLAAAGFQPGTPDRIGAESRRIDAACAWRSPCPACRKGGRTYRPFTDGERYRAVAFCERCQVAEEF
jgi:hypothetical protein